MATYRTAIYRATMYRDTQSYAVHKLHIRAYGTNGPRDMGEISQGPALKIFGSQHEAEHYADACRKEHGADETTAWSVTARWHDSKGRIVDQEQDLYVG